MNFLKLNVCVAIGLMSLSGLSAANKKTGKVLPYKNPKLSIEQRVEDLLSRMTLEEKVRQLSALRMGEGDEVFRTSGHYSEDNVRKQFGTHGMGHISLPLTDLDAAAAVRTANMMQKIALEETRLGIPVLINDEACHGYIGRGATSYPQSIALSSTWDLNLMSEIADAIGKELPAGVCIRYFRRYWIWDATHAMAEPRKLMEKTPIWHPVLVWNLLKVSRATM